MKLDKLTKKELLDLAAAKKVAGRSKMSKDELIKALEPFFAEPAPAKDASMSKNGDSCYEDSVSHFKSLTRTE